MSTYALGSQEQEDGTVARVGTFDSLEEARSKAFASEGWRQVRDGYWMADGGVIQQVWAWHIKRID